jgi:hypothetical protein
MELVVTLAAGLLTSLGGCQIGYLWSFEELTAKADLVVIATLEATKDTGRRAEHPNLKPGLPVAELATTFKVLAVLKPDPAAAAASSTRLQITHYRIDLVEWIRRNPPLPDRPTPGLVNTGTTLDLTKEAGSYLMFLKRGPGDLYEPLSGHTFPTDSVYLLRKW